MSDYFDCPNCGAEVPIKAKSCPDCGSDEKNRMVRGYYV